MHVIHVCIILLWRNIGAKTSDSRDGTPLSTRWHEADPLQSINALMTARMRSLQQQQEQDGNKNKAAK